MYTMQSRVRLEKLGTAEIVDIFLKEMQQSQVVEVQDDKFYQKQDVDVLVTTGGRERKMEIKVDFKGDVTGNIFCETVSNKDKGTQGCFLYTECDIWLYYLYNTKMLYVFPMDMFRDWVLSQEHNVFKTKPTATQVGDDYYTSEGLIVPIDVILNKAPDLVKVFDLSKKERVH